MRRGTTASARPTRQAPSSRRIWPRRSWRNAEDQERDKAKIEELTKKLDDKADEMAKCGDEDQAKYDALEAQLKEKMDEYEALHKKVCAMLGEFNLPSGNSSV